MQTITGQSFRNSFFLVNERTGEVLDILTQHRQQRELTWSSSSHPVKELEQVDSRASEARLTRWRDSDISLHTLFLQPQAGPSRLPESDDPYEKREQVRDHQQLGNDDNRFLTFKRDPALIRSIRGRGYHPSHTRPDVQANHGDRCLSTSVTGMPVLGGTQQWSILGLDEKTRTRTSFGGSSFYTAFDDHPGQADEDEDVCRGEGDGGALLRADGTEDGMRLTGRDEDAVGKRERLELFSIPHPDDVIVDEDEPKTTDTIDLDQAQTTILDQFWASLFAASSSSGETSGIGLRKGAAGLGTTTVSSWIVDSLSGLFNSTTTFLYNQISVAAPVGRKGSTKNGPTSLVPEIKRGDPSESVLGSIPLIATMTARETPELVDIKQKTGGCSGQDGERGSGWGVWYFSDEGVSHRVWTGSVDGSGAVVGPFDEVVEGIRR